MSKPVRVTDAEAFDDLEAPLSGPFPPDDGLSDEESDALADADIAAGRVVSHERVAEWLRELKTDPGAPRPTAWRK